MSSTSRNLNSCPRIIVSCAGLGMGNASRMIAILEQLDEQSKKIGCPIKLTVLSWGAGYTFFEKYREQAEFDFELCSLFPYFSKNALSFAKTFFRNTKLLKHKIKLQAPDLIVLDSDYHFPAYFFYRRPIIYIGQAYDVLKRARTLRYTPGPFKEKLNFILREKFDFYFQSIVSTRLIVPSFEKDVVEKKCSPVSLIVRKEFKKQKRETESQNLLILLSGSTIESEPFRKIGKNYSTEIISPSAEKPLHISDASDIDSHQFIFTQGGLTSISEVIARKKPMIVFPMKNHPEQLLNAQSIEKLGLGLTGTMEDLENIPALIEKLKQIQPAHMDCNGAEESAKIILSYLKPFQKEERY